MEYLLILIIAIAAGSGDDESREEATIEQKPAITESVVQQSNMKSQNRYRRNEYGYVEANLAYAGNSCKTFIVSDLDAESLGEQKIISATKVKVGCSHEK